MFEYPDKPDLGERKAFEIDAAWDRYRDSLPLKEHRVSGLIPLPPVDPSLALYTQPPPEGKLSEQQAAAVASDFLPRIVLAQGQMEAILQGKARQGEYLLGVEKSLGTSPVVAVCAWRPKAIHIVNGEVKAESYDPNSDEYADIVRDAGRSKDEKEEGDNASYGPDFLLWTAHGWGTFMFGGTARERGREVFGLIGKGMAMGSEIKKSKKFTWLVPTVKPIESIPFAPPSEKDTMGAVKVFTAPLLF